MLAVMKGRELFVANAGDSRAVLGRAGQAVALSEDHKPASTSEKQRITDAGGFVSEVRPLLFDRFFAYDFLDLSGHLDTSQQHSCTGSNLVPAWCGMYLDIQQTPMDMYVMAVAESLKCCVAAAKVGGVTRVNGNLNLSRAIGDLRYKGNGEIPPEKQIITAQVRCLEVCGSWREHSGCKLSCACCVTM